MNASLPPLHLDKIEKISAALRAAGYEVRDGISNIRFWKPSNVPFEHNFFVSIPHNSRDSIKVGFRTNHVDVSFEVQTDRFDLQLIHARLQHYFDRLFLGIIRPPIIERGGKYFYWDSEWTEQFGPFDTKIEANNHIDFYLGLSTTR